jgi:hypothetical protein
VLTGAISMVGFADPSGVVTNNPARSVPRVNTRKREAQVLASLNHPHTARSRTPSNAILVTAAVSLALALTGTFRSMVLASAVTRLVT